MTTIQLHDTGFSDATQPDGIKSVKVGSLTEEGMHFSSPIQTFGEDSTASSGHHMDRPFGTHIQEAVDIVKDWIKSRD